MSNSNNPLPEITAEQFGKIYALTCVHPHFLTQDQLSCIIDALPALLSYVERAQRAEDQRREKDQLLAVCNMVGSDIVRFGEYHEPLKGGLDISVQKEMARPFTAILFDDEGDEFERAEGELTDVCKAVIKFRERVQGGQS